MKSKVSEFEDCPASPPGGRGLLTSGVTVLMAWHGLCDLNAQRCRAGALRAPEDWGHGPRSPLPTRGRWSLTEGSSGIHSYLENEDNNDA